MGLDLVTRAAEPLMGLAEAKLHCRVDDSMTDDDGHILMLVQAATDHLETVTARALVTQTWDWTLDRFPAWEMEVPKPRLQSVTSIAYVDTDGASQTLSSSLYTAAVTSERGRITPAYGESWPSTRSVMEAVTIRIVAGYGSPADVPEPLKNAAKLLLAHWYNTREPVAFGGSPKSIPLTFAAIVAPYKSHRF